MGHRTDTEPARRLLEGTLVPIPAPWPSGIIAAE